MTRTASLLRATIAANEQVGPELTARGRVSRERIVRAALELMLEHGVAATTIEDVLQRAKASKSQLYHYFGGMPRLIESVIAAAEISVLTAHRPHIDRIDSSESLRAWADHVVALNEAYGPDLGCPLGTLSAELTASDDRARAQLEASFERWIEPIRRGIEVMRQNGELSDGADPALLATAVIASLQGGLLLAKMTRSSVPVSVALDSALAYVGTFRAV